jgi:hypothetical protein
LKRHRGKAALPEWQAAIEALMLVADLGVPTMFARIGVMKALHRHVERAFNPDRKDHHWGKRTLKGRSEKLHSPLHCRVPKCPLQLSSSGEYFRNESKDTKVLFRDGDIGGRDTPVVDCRNLSFIATIHSTKRTTNCCSGQDRRTKRKAFAAVLHLDAISVFTFWLNLATIGLVIVAALQIWLLMRSERISAQAADAATEAATARPRVRPMSALWALRSRDDACF